MKGLHGRVALGLGLGAFHKILVMVEKNGRRCLFLDLGNEEGLKYAGQVIDLQVQAALNPTTRHDRRLVPSFPVLDVLVHFQDVTHTVVVHTPR